MDFSELGAASDDASPFPRISGVGRRKCHLNELWASSEDRCHRLDDLCDQKVDEPQSESRDRGKQEGNGLLCGFDSATK
jgi:hypothetical protein